MAAREKHLPQILVAQIVPWSNGLRRFSDKEQTMVQFHLVRPMTRSNKLLKILGVLVIFACAFGVSYFLPKIIVSAFVLAISIPLTILLVAVGLYVLHKTLQSPHE